MHTAICTNKKSDARKVSLLIQKSTIIHDTQKRAPPVKPITTDLTGHTNQYRPNQSLYRPKTLRWDLVKPIRATDQQTNHHRPLIKPTTTTGLPINTGHWSNSSLRVNLTTTAQTNRYRLNQSPPATGQTNHHHQPNQSPTAKQIPTGRINRYHQRK